MIASLSALPATATDNLQARFLALLPKIERCARFYFRHITCSAKRTDGIAETVGLCCYADLRIMRRPRKKPSEAGGFCGVLLQVQVAHVAIIRITLQRCCSRSGAEGPEG